jgi:hypothetical protein
MKLPAAEKNQFNTIIIVLRDFGEVLIKVAVREFSPKFQLGTCVHIMLSQAGE